MAIIDIIFRSEVLELDTGIKVILPENAPAEDIPTLYLLHGLHGNQDSWSRKSGIERYAEERQVAVVMPDGDTSYYQDMKYGRAYYTYISEELIAYTRKVFRLSHKREKTFIAGLSMGGYGAFYIGLRRPDLFAGCANLSGCVDMAEHLKTWPHGELGRVIWGEEFRTCTKDTPSDLMWLIENFPADMPKPKLYSACGRQDYLYGENISFRDFMKDKDFDFTYVEDEGAHTWDFWDRWIAPAMDAMMNRKNLNEK